MNVYVPGRMRAITTEAEDTQHTENLRLSKNTSISCHLLVKVLSKKAVIST